MDSDITAELEELEERNRGLQLELDRIDQAEQQAKAQRETVDKQAEALRQELTAARSRLERAALIRSTCKRLTCLEGKLGPIGGASKGNLEIVKTKSGVLLQIFVACVAHQLLQAFFDLHGLSFPLEHPVQQDILKRLD